MALSSCPAPVLIGDSSLQNWKIIGSGGFGQIYKARHLKWGCDVAIKLLHYDDGSSSLLREVDLMRQGSSPYVLQVMGVFKGRLPSSGSSTQLGLVMEFMETGSLASLQDILCGPPPWPLAFRLAHQVALGMNFLHSLTPALLHLDLKPSNVLLDSSLNAKLTDFGLARYYHSVTRGSKRDNEEEVGTISYMPPEAFDISYSPTQASDIYSYGILLWSIVTGKQPYPHAISSMVRFRIPQGDRPSLDEINQAGELRDVVELMKRCWNQNHKLRPRFLECTDLTEKMYKRHKIAINDAVHEVLAKLEKNEEERRRTERATEGHVTRPLASPQVEAVKVCHNVLTGSVQTQETAGGLTANQRDKVSIKGQTSPRPTSAPHTDPVHSSSSHKVPSQPPPPSSWPGRTYQDIAAKPSPNLPPSQYQRQFSIPVSIQLSNVTGLQIGNNNHMYLYTSDRKRHPTAPSSINLPSPHSGHH